MPGRIRQEDIVAVRERSPIADVIGDYLQLRPAGGGNLKGLCPFHQERSPSFNVTPGKELYHCFSCGEGGDVIKFVMQMETCSSPRRSSGSPPARASSFATRQGGYVPGQETGQRRRLIEAHRRPRSSTPSGSHADAAPYRARLPGRARLLPSPTRTSSASATRRRLGRADQAPARPGLHRRRADQGGPGRRTSRGGLIDMFRGRLMWPIRDLTGETIAFGARKLNPTRTTRST